MSLVFGGRIYDEKCAISEIKNSLLSSDAHNEYSLQNSFENLPYVGVGHCEFFCKLWNLFLKQESFVLSLENKSLCYSVNFCSLSVFWQYLFSLYRNPLSPIVTAS